MPLYHMSDTAEVGDILVPDYKNNLDLVEPFIKALNISFETFIILVLNAEYTGAVLAKYGLSGMPSHKTKWATEAIFEYVRRQEFPDAVSRMNCSFLYSDISRCRQLYDNYWNDASEEERSKIRLFEVEARGNMTVYDMKLYDEAFDLLSENCSIDDVLECMMLARKYYHGEKGKEPLLETLSDVEVILKRELKL